MAWRRRRESAGEIAEPLSLQDRTKPVALIAVGAGKDLQGALDESGKIAELLTEAGYLVKVLKKGTRDELDTTLSSEEVQYRLCIFHFCGHADGEATYLTGADGDERIYAGGLAELLSVNHKSLRLIFLNGCDSGEQLDAFREKCPNAAVIGANFAIGDAMARDLAVDFYRKLASQGSKSTRDVREAFQLALGALKTKYADADLYYTSAFPQPFFLGAGSALILQYIERNMVTVSFRPFMWWAIIAALVGTLVAYLAHQPLSSPAFQAAFSYPEHQLGGVSAGSSGFDDCDPVAKRKDGEFVCLSSQLKPGSDLSRNGPMFGAFVEVGRFYLLIGLFLLTAWWMRRHALPHEVVLTWRNARAWMNQPMNFWAVVVLIIATLVVVAYHLWWAPASLARFEEARWRAMRCDCNLWLYAGEDWVGQARLFKETLTAGSAPLESGSPLYRALYNAPYLVYLTYSLLAFVGISMVGWYCIIRGTVWSNRWIRLHTVHLSDILRSVSPESRDLQLGFVKKTFNLLAKHLQRYLFLIFGFLCVVFYETFLGYQTVAAAPQIFIFLVLAFMIAGGIVVLATTFGYAQALQDFLGRSNLSENDVAAWRPYHVDRLFLSRRSLVLLALDITGLAVAIYYGLRRIVSE